MNYQNHVCFIPIFFHRHNHPVHTQLLKSSSHVSQGASQGVRAHRLSSGLWKTDRRHLSGHVKSL